MAKGGARARSGPPPDPNALRRERDGGDWVTLPSAGRSGKTPAWPLSKASPRETVLWKVEWRRPQAVMWERNRQELEVALYVRSLVAAEDAEASVAARTLVRQQQEALGLSLPGLARNRWKIEDASITPVPRASSAGRSVRDRFRVVPGGNGAA